MVDRDEEGKSKVLAEHRGQRRRQLAARLCAAAFAKAYLESLIPSAFEQLAARGFFYASSMQQDINKNFYLPMAEKAIGFGTCERRARLLVDGVIREVSCYTLTLFLPKYDIQDNGQSPINEADKAY